MPELTVLFADAKGAADWEWIRALPAASQLHLIAPGDNREETLRDLLAQADVIVAQTRPITAELLQAAPRLKLIQCYGRRPVVDHAAARAAGVQVATMPLHGCIAVAELAITLLLALSKNLVRAHAATVSGAYRELGVEPIKTEQRKHKFQWMNMQPQMLEVVGRTLGIIGYGEIGSETAQRAQALGMRVLYNKRHRLPHEVETAEGVSFAGKEELLRDSDFVLLSTPLTAETEKMIGAPELAQMKPSAFLVNICRGGVVDEDALVAALHARQIAGAGLDVFVYEPIPYDHPLLQCDNVILTPHIGGGTGGARDRQMNDVLINVLAFAQGQAIAHRVA